MRVGFWSIAIAGFAALPAAAASAAVPCPTLARLGELSLPPADRVDRFKRGNPGDPLLRNVVINADYRQLSIGLDAYLGYGPEADKQGPPNWWALAHAASTTAGLTLELVSRALTLLGDMSHRNIAGLTSDRRRAAFVPLTPTIVKNAANYLNAKLRVAFEARDPQIASRVAADFQNVYVGFAAGNLFIYREEGELMTRFLTQAAASPSCAVNVDGLRTAGEWKDVDPYGLVRAGLKLLVQARTEPDAKAKAELIHRSSLLIGFQEQWMVQSKVFDKYQLAPIFESFRGDIADGHGVFKLVDGNWAHFPVRMGVRNAEGRALTMAEFDVAWKRPDGTYKFSPAVLPTGAESSDQGTIRAYFRDRLTRSPTSKMYLPLAGPFGLLK
jgi:hypothetical protein